MVSRIGLSKVKEINHPKKTRRGLPLLKAGIVRIDEETRKPKENFREEAALRRKLLSKWKDC